MEHKDLWLVISLTMILAVTVSISSVAITGDAIFWNKKVTTIGKAPITVTPLSLLPSCVYVDARGYMPGDDSPTADQLCKSKLNNEYRCSSVVTRYRESAWEDSKCNKNMLYEWREFYNSNPFTYNVNPDGSKTTFCDSKILDIQQQPICSRSTAKVNGKFVYNLKSIDAIDVLCCE